LEERAAVQLLPMVVINFLGKPSNSNAEERQADFSIPRIGYSLEDLGNLF
jgi:hypothetical protein